MTAIPAASAATLGGRAAWIALTPVALAVAAIRRLPKDEALLVGRASEAGENFA